MDCSPARKISICIPDAIIISYRPVTADDKKLITEIGNAVYSYKKFVIFKAAAKSLPVNSVVVLSVLTKRSEFSSAITTPEEMITGRNIILLAAVRP